MDILRRFFLFIGGFMYPAILLTVVLLVLLILWARKKDRTHKSFLYRDTSDKLDAAQPEDESGKHRKSPHKV
ncbi:hypothetical protein [Paenibacillus beijingensis]|uniref:Uncharacterized protein n=1 Tax=Paenibacillus beijingensis TaxID=1126833 RepID=A0A0D5NET3_9BACL|nr:hypothetical protein [Paenibacillus beijingensis]AJY73741.1 hypothetical protein VN24_02730 [Paenibacillus beijingensis]